MRVDASALPALAARPDVVRISAIVPKHPSNAHTAQLTKVLNAWEDLGATGAGIKIGVIDTGIDYTHADFGGVGTAEAYQAALATSDTAAGKNWHEELPAAAQAKIAGGWDFVGNNYDADPTSATYQPVPHPDGNPLDCNEHGTHVSGTAAGYGVNADGSTFQGDYSSLTGADLDAMRIGPGMAPEAELYALKVFGCEGSTDVVIPALDWALDPNGDGDFSDHLDVVNLSLGSDYATPDDPENAVIDKIAENGVLPVIAMGNNGDLTDTGGSPGNAIRSLAVASSVDSFQLLSGIRVNAPVGLASPAVGQVSIAYPWATKPDVTGDVVELSDPNNRDGCDPLSTADAALVKGKVAWLTWDSNDATRRCGSAGRSANVKAAGAVGAIFTGDVPVFSAGITGDPDIPVFQLTMTETQRLQAAADAGSLNVTFTKDLLNNQPSNEPSLNDLLSSFSSRGTHGSIGVVKPDVTAPGDTIVSAGMGTGNEVLSISGTSMATPHTAGIAALVRAEHPDWTPEQVKAAIMNTAGHDLYTEQNQSGQIYGPARVGAGRVDALAALQTTVLAYNTDVPGGVSASFGVVEAPIGQPTVTRTRTIELQNTGDSAASLSVSYDGVIAQPGVSYSVSPTNVAVGAGQSATVTVTMTVNPAQLKHTIDPTMQTEQIGVPRQYVADASGRVLVTPAGGPQLRVPVYGAAKPVSSMSASMRGTNISLTGKGFAEGAGSTDYTSLVSVMELGASSPKLPACSAKVVTGCTINQTAQGGDIRYVGAGSSPGPDGTLTDGWLWFGVSTWGDSATIGNTMIPYVDFDTTGDGVPDYEVYAQNYPGTDVLLAWLVDLSTNEVLDLEPINMNFGDVDTNAFDTDVMLLPVWPRMIGITGQTKKFPISYTVGTFSPYAVNPSGDIDDVGPIRYDAAKPNVQVAAPLFADLGGTVIPTKITGNAQALVLHLHNASGNRAQVVSQANGNSHKP
jgi:subtilisin family serine protease